MDTGQTFTHSSLCSLYHATSSQHRPHSFVPFLEDKFTLLFDQGQPQELRQAAQWSAHLPGARRWRASYALSLAREQRRPDREG